MENRTQWLWTTIVTIALLGAVTTATGRNASLKIEALRDDPGHIVSLFN